MQDKTGCAPGGWWERISS